MFNRKELQRIREKALEASNYAQDEYFANAYYDLAKTADCIDALLAREEPHTADEEKGSCPPPAMGLEELADVLRSSIDSCIGVPNPYGIHKKEPTITPCNRSSLN